MSDLYSLFQKHPAICTDSRHIKPGCLFFALKGAHFNGNHFAEKAIADGAAYAVIDEKLPTQNSRYILVNDALAALQDLAREHRKQLHIPVIGLTGTNGKTTTKELVAAVLAQKYNTFATAGNLNNHIGVPLSILSIQKEHEIAVIEMGANHQREIALLCSIARPDYGLITNVGKAHLEGFGGIEGVKKAKGELYEHLAGTGGTAFISYDNAALMEMKDKAGLEKAVYYGTCDESTVQARVVKISPHLKIEWWHTREPENVHDIHSHLTGAYNAENMLAAVCIGDHFKVEDAQIDLGIAGYHPNNNRSQIVQTRRNTVVCDFYNANPSSMFAALENMARMEGEKKILILADMLELGIDSPAEHETVIRHALEIPDAECLFIGPDFGRFEADFIAQFFTRTADAGKWLEDNPVENRTVLLKGSRGMKLEDLLPLL